MQPSNDNNDPLRRPDRALAELYRARREVLAADTSNRPLSWWRERQRFLDDFERLERRILEHL